MVKPVLKVKAYYNKPLFFAKLDEVSKRFTILVLALTFHFKGSKLKKYNVHSKLSVSGRFMFTLKKL